MSFKRSSTTGDDIPSPRPQSPNVEQIAERNPPSKTNIKKKEQIINVYICTTVGRIIFNQQIEEAIQGTLKASRFRDKSLPAIII